MINKFISISGTGKFLKYDPAVISGSHRIGEFQRINLLYGENGIGKTTLAIIFKSLQGNNSLLLKKRSFDRTSPQRIEILTDETQTRKFIFNGGSWDSHCPGIEVFDTHFINENIFAGFELQSSHMKNLFEVIFGHQGIVLKNEIQSIKEEIKEKNKKIREVSAKIDIITGNAFTAKNYCDMNIDTDIENKIASKEAEINTAKKSSEIGQKNSLNLLSQLNLPLDKISAISILESTIDTISQTYLDEFNKHKSHLKAIENAEQWLSDGYSLITENTCPFCMREFTGNENIIEAYNQYFNEAYNILKRKITQSISELDNFNIEVELLKIKNEIIANETLTDYWKQHITNPPLITDVLQSKDSIITAYSELKELFSEKKSEPLSKLLGEKVEELYTKVEVLNAEISSLNALITNYNQSIAALKSSNTPNLIQLEKDLKKLVAIKKRSEQNTVDFCNELTTALSELEVLNSTKDTKKLELDTYSSTLFTTYASKINNYLRAFAPYLEIKDLGSAYVGSSTEPVFKYGLTILGNDIKLQEDAFQPTFKYSLSEGDKSALALAFFLSKLEVEGNLGDKIIIFDDPVSSFDLNRKSTTISKLIHFGQSAKQLFVLTHNILFAGEFWKSAIQTGLSCRCGNIVFFQDTSCLSEYDIDLETLSSVLKDSHYIKNYLINGGITDQERRNVARCLRPALESYFHLKFFDLILPNEWLGNFIDKVRNSTVNDPFNRLNPFLSEMEDINNYSKKYHHRFNHNADNEQVTDAELRNYCDRTLKLIQHI